MNDHPDRRARPAHGAAAEAKQAQLEAVWDAQRQKMIQQVAFDAHGLILAAAAVAGTLRELVNRFDVYDEDLAMGDGSDAGWEINQALRHLRNVGRITRARLDRQRAETVTAGPFDLTEDERWQVDEARRVAGLWLSGQGETIQPSAESILHDAVEHLLEILTGKTTTPPDAGAAPPGAEA